MIFFFLSEFVSSLVTRPSFQYGMFTGLFFGVVVLLVFFIVVKYVRYSWLFFNPFFPLWLFPYPLPPPDNPSHYETFTKVSSISLIVLDVLFVGRVNEALGKEPTRLCQYRTMSFLIYIQKKWRDPSLVRFSKLKSQKAFRHREACPVL